MGNETCHISKGEGASQSRKLLSVPFRQVLFIFGETSLGLVCSLVQSNILHRRIGIQIRLVCQWLSKTPVAESIGNADSDSI